MRTILASVLAIFIGASIFAQSPTGSIGGIVFDSDAKTIPGAEIIVVNDLTRVQYETKTNDGGIYAVPNLPPGPYHVQASKLGFKTLIKPDIILNVQDAITVNFTLPVGATSIAVTVEGGVPIVNTTDATVSTVVDRQFAENLPLNGRSFQSLIYLTPGVVATASTSTDGGQFSVNGQRAASNYWMVDGVSANIGISAGNSSGNGVGGTLGSFSALGGTNSLVSVDAMQEFRIQTSSYAPEFGRTPGGQISIATRSGTDQFHGTLFEYLRNDVFDANNWFANQKGLAKPEERQNDFGGTFSGPIRKDQTFFFFSYEGLRLRLPQTTLTSVPDSASRAKATPAMQPYLNTFPLPNGTDNMLEGIAQFNASYSDPATLDAYSLRADHRFNRHFGMFGRYSYSPSQYIARGTSGGFGALNDLQTFRITTETATAAMIWSISTTATNDLRFNYSRTNASSQYFMDNFGGGVPLANPPFPNQFTVQNAIFTFFLFPLGMGEQVTVGRNANNLQRQVNLVDGLSWQRATHSIKFGVDYRRLSPTIAPPKYQQEGLLTNLLGAGSRGLVFGNTDGGLLFHNLGAFAQDTWRVLPVLTITYGLRWDVDWAPSSSNGPSIPAVTGYSLTDLSQIALAPSGTAAFKTTFSNVAPRIGVAYLVRQKNNSETVLRGGFGVFYDLVSSEAGNLLSFGTPPFSGIRVFSHAQFPFTAEQVAPVAIEPPTISNLFAFNPNLKLPYTLEWSVAAQQGLGRNQSLTVSYLGASGRRLLQTTILQGPPTNSNLFANFVDNTANSNYNALQVQYQRRLSAGLQALGSYTWSHSIDDASASSYGNGSNLGVPGNGNGNRGSSDFDIRNTLTAGLTYAVPSAHSNWLVHAISRDWSLQTFILARSAMPVDLTDINFFEFNGNVFANIRPDIVAGQPFYVTGSGCLATFGAACPGGRGFNPAAFVDPPIDPTTGNPVRQGNLPRNALRGFGATQWDLGVHRDFLIHESLKLQFRAEMFNVLNHPNFGPPQGQFGGSGFGLANQMLGQSLSGSNLGGGGLNPLYQIGGPRSIQIALKFFF